MILRALPHHVVRRHRPNVLRTISHHHQVTIRHARVEAHPIRPEALLNQPDELPAFLRGDVTRAVIQNPTVLHGDEIAPKRHLIVRQCDPHTGRLQRRASGEITIRVVAQNLQIGDVAPRRLALRNRTHPASNAISGDEIHIGCVSRFQWRFPA